jgi:hypothetical protein
MRLSDGWVTASPSRLPNSAVHGVKGEERSVRYPEEVSEILSKRDEDDVEDIKEDEFEIACDSDTRRRAGGLGVRKEEGGICVRECVILMKEMF